MIHVGMAIVRKPNSHQAAAPWPRAMPNPSKLRLISGCPVGSKPNQVTSENRVQDTSSVTVRMLMILPIDSSR